MILRSNSRSREIPGLDKFKRVAKNGRLYLMIQGAADKPDFLWDETLSRDQLKRLLANGNEEERFYYAAKILREARFEEVWEYLTPVFFGRYWDKLRTRLGRKKQFWRFLHDTWKSHGLIP
jgi:hypothetical protein